MTNSPETPTSAIEDLKPTMEKDGYEVIYRPLGSETDLPREYSILHIGIKTGDAMTTPVHSYLVYDHARVEALQFTATSLESRKKINDALSNDGYQIIEPSDFDSHVVAARIIPQQIDQPAPEAPSSQ